MNQHFLRHRQHYKNDMMARYGINERTYDEASLSIAPLATHFSLRRGEMLQRAGQANREVFWLTGGVARVGYVSETGAEITARFATEGQGANAFEDYLEFRDDQQVTSFIVAETALNGYRFDWQAVCRVLGSSNALSAYHKGVLEHALGAQSRRFVTHSASDAEQRLSIFRLDYPGLERRISQKVLASYLQITPAYLSQLIRRESERNAVA
ncbi:Crp/Fnr family transcriptional regulator [Pseudoduganella sp. RAF53_2]|uniref:Crp/Fnr family transcriptional regulator n=1 Tax=unclassified Pseudoduganella TaxID=2637179 RepID=UPI003F9510BC